MKTLQMKKTVIAIILAIISMFSSLLCACGDGSSDVNTKINDFYGLMHRSQVCLDEVADDIYRNWHDAIYNDKFSGNINTAIYRAQLDNSENLDIIEQNDEQIQSLYKEIRDSELSSEIKEVMTAYNEYYEFVVNVSGSYNSFSANSETLKKKLASALRNLEMEI